MRDELRVFAPGERVVIREVLRGKVWTSRPVTVVEDSRAQFVSYLAPGTIIEYPVGVSHGRVTFDMWCSGEWELGDKVFSPPGMLRIAPARAPFEVFAPVTPGAGVLSWYVNLQRPLCRTPVGFDTMDETLDLLVSADFADWERKDADELALAVQMGVYDDAEAARITRSCELIEKALGRGEVPWDRSWRDWRPSRLMSPA